MTGLASRGGRDVVRRFAQRRRAVMARGTARRDPRVAELRSRKGRRRSVAQFAGRRRRDMRRCLAPCGRAVMTGRAPAHDPGMIKHGARKRRRGSVAGLTGLRRRDVRGRLAPCRRPVMARRAPAHDPRVVKHGPQERGGRPVARLAGRRRRDMRGRLAARRRPVMARRAPRRDPRVIECRARKRRRRPVARLAGRRRRDVCRRLASRCRSVMARRAATHDPRMIISVGHKHPICRAHSMAGIARSSCRHVPGRLPWSLDTVVTSCTSTWPNPRMLEGRTGPANRPVATVAAHGRRNMTRRLACHGSLVMAFGAGSRNDTVMGKKCWGPICRPMAAAAVNHSRQVVRWLKGGDDSSAW